MNNTFKNKIRGLPKRTEIYNFRGTTFYQTQMYVTSQTNLGMLSLENLIILQ